MQAKHDPFRQRWFGPHSAELAHGAQELPPTQIGVGLAQVLQEMVLPHPSGLSPQALLGQVGVHPQTFATGGVPPPQVSVPVQMPQSIVPVPHPLSMLPQFRGGGQAVCGVQPQTPGTVPPPQVCGGVHGAQSAPPVPQVALVRDVIQVSPAQHPEQVVAHPGRAGAGGVEAQRPVPSSTSP